MSSQLNSVAEKVRKGGNQGGNQGGNRKSVVPTFDNHLKISALSDEKVWLTVHDGSHLLDVTTRAIKKACKAGKYVTRFVQGNGGMQYQIALSSLPEKAQKRWEMERLSEMDRDLNRTSTDMVKQDQEFDVLDLEELQRMYCESPDYNRKKYDKYYHFFHNAGYFVNRYLPPYSKLLKLIEAWNEHPDHQQLTYKSVVRVEKELREHGYSAFFGNYGQSAGVHLSFARLDTPVANHLFQTFRTNYLKASAPTIEVCYRLVKMEAKRLGVDVALLPSSVSFDRAVKSELVRKYGVSPASALYRARNGADAWARKFGNYCDRNDDDLVAGSTWVFDHMQVDQMVKAPDGTLRRFWVTGIVDMRSWKFLYYSLNTLPPCTDDIKLAYIGAVVKYGAPEIAYMDNGKDFRSRDFSGQNRKIRVQYQEQFLGSVLGMTGVNEIKFAIKYNAKAKIIERVFRKLHNNLERVIGDGYTGSNPTQRTKELSAMIKSGNVMSYEEFIAAMDTVITMMNETPMTRKRETTNGMTPDEVFMKFGEPLPAVDPDVLYRLTGRMSSMRQVGRNGFEDSEVSKVLGYKALYWGDWMLAWQGNGDRVYARRDLESPDVAFFYTENDHRYLGPGHLDYFQTMAIAKSGEDSDQVSRVIGAVQGHNRMVTAAIKTKGGSTGRDILTAASGDSLQLISGQARVPNENQVSAKTGTDGGLLTPAERDRRNMELLRREDEMRRQSGVDNYW
jgi:hypothetical protein